MNLSPAQDAIVHAPIGPMLVTATAGSGKTRVLTERIRFLLQQHPKDGVLALTFTNKAAEEMQTRLKGINQLEHRTFIGTLHSFAQDLLQQHGHHIGVAQKLHIFERDEDKLRLLDEIIERPSSMVGESKDEYLGKTLDRERRDELFKWLNEISKAKRNLWTDQEIMDHSEHGEQALYTYNSYQESLDLHGAIDFDDLLLLAYRLMTEKPRIAKLVAQLYPHVCIDEAQDLNKAQYEFLKAFCLDRIQSVMMVGDPNQSIYGFNDSSAEYMQEYFVEDFHAAIHPLIDNYRSSKWVLELANKIKPASMKNMNAATHGGGEFFEAASSEEEASWICDQIEEWLKQKSHPEIEGQISLENMVVLARNRYVFLPLHEELERRNMEHYLKKTLGPSDPVSEIGKVFDWAMRISLNDKDQLHKRQLRQMIGSLNDNDWSSCKSEWMPIIEAAFKGVNTNLSAKQPSMASCILPLKSLLQKRAISFSEDEIENALHDLQDFETHWNRYTAQLPTGAQSSLESFRSAMAMGKTQPDQKENGLALSTVHTMKGLEYDIVFLMGMGQGTFPDYRAIGKTKAMIEEDNNAFVAVTRAKRFLYISYSRTKQMPWGAVKPQISSVYWNKLKESL